MLLLNTLGVVMNETRLEVRIALEQGWEAYRHGSFPVGSVVLDPAGAILAVGRNRMGEANAPDGRLRATAIAHAEMDVLAQLPPGDYTDYRLITTLEPCLLCRSAATLASMGTVEYLAADLLWEGLEALALTIAASSRGGTTRDYQSRSPAAYAVALRIVENDDWPARSLDLGGAMTHVNALAQ
jgi:tRNA(Arg) A34 adenosine deaminase TadA